MAKQNAQPAKGTRDLLPVEMRRRHYAVALIREVFERYGFEPLETPAIERLDALLGKYGEEGDQLLFKVLLRGQPLVDGIRTAHDHVSAPGNLVTGRSGVTAPGAEAMLADLGLRYDLTVPLARVYAAHQSELPSVFKRYQIQPVWRADTPGKGRYREFYQCDVDVVGSDSRIVEAEVLGAACECMQRLGFREFDVRLNHRQLLRALVEHAGISAQRETDAIVAIDKLDKIGRDGVARELDGKGIGAESRDALLSVLDNPADLEALSASLGDNEIGRAAVADLKAVLELCQRTAASDHVRLDLTLARGLGYYTGCIFEVAVPDLAGSLGGGGRYDGLVGMFSGRNVPACGFALGLERILLVMAERDMYPASLTHIDASVAAIDAADMPGALSLSRRLREAGLRVDLYPKAMKPGKIRQLADERGHRAAVWLEPGGSESTSLWTRSDGKTRQNLDLSTLTDMLRAMVATAQD